jgi:soluble lytic murein transglycosylase
MPSKPPLAVDSQPAPDLLKLGLAQHAAGDVAAVETFQLIMSSQPGTPAASEARYRLIESLIDAHRDAEALEAALRLAQDEPRHPMATSALLLAGRLRREQGQLAGAIELYRRYLAQDTLLAGYVLREIAGMQATLRQPAEAIASYRAALEAGLQPEYAQPARRASAEMATQLKDYAQALQWWASYGEGARSSFEKATAVYYTALIQKETGDATANATLAGLVQTYPQTWFALQGLEMSLSAGVETPVLQQAAVYYANRANDKAIAAYRRYLELFPSGDQAGLARYRLAILQQRLGNLAQAIAELDEVHRQYANETFVRDAWLEIARTLLRLDRRAEALAQYEQVAAWYPGSVEAEQALWEAAMLYYRQGQAGASASLLARLGDGFPASASASRTRFWQAKSLLAGGQSAQARQVLESLAAGKRLGYYTLRARELLGQTSTASSPAVADERAAFMSWLQGWAGPPTTIDVRTNVHLRRALLLRQARLFGEAATEFSLARADMRSDPWALAAFSEHMAELGIPQQSIAAANRVLALSQAALVDAPRYLGRLIFPMPYRDLVEQAAAQNGLDPLWFYALMYQESLFDRYAFSSAEARGLTQVIASTGVEIARRLSVADFRQDDLFRPVVSIHFGVWYLAQQAKSADGNLFVGLAAYNGGLGNARRWAANQKQPLDLDLFIEDIGFSETQAFVRLIYEHHAAYEWVWGGR